MPRQITVDMDDLIRLICFAEAILKNHMPLACESRTKTIEAVQRMCEVVGVPPRNFPEPIGELAEPR